MANYLYNGVELPDINAVWTDKETYPYAAVITVATNQYLFFISSMPFEWDAVTNAMVSTGTAVAKSYGAEVGYTEWVYDSDSNWVDGTTMYSGLVPHWSNYDILNADGSIYLTASDPVAIAFILPDGTELPALPEGCFEKYPYGMISYVESTDGEAAYALSVAEGTYIFAPGSATGEGSDYVSSLLPGYRHYRYVVAPTAASGWEQYAESTTQHSGHDFSREDGTIEIRWCNHDILTATAMNDDGTPEIGPDLYRKSDVNYRIYGGWLNSMGNQARRLGNVSGALKPGEMESVFSGATLEPLTVTPTTEEQTFTPESPCIGFSSVTVEAAPDTGGGDIVEPEEPEELPEVDGAMFGAAAGPYGYETLDVSSASVAANKNWVAQWSFVPNQNINVSGIRFCATSGGTKEKLLRIWDTNLTVLAEIVTYYDSSSNWLDCPLDEPIELTAGVQYFVGMWVKDGYTSYKSYGTTVTYNPLITFKGSYSNNNGYGGMYALANTYRPSLYLVDIIIGSSDLSDTYQISRTMLDSLANQVNRITGTTGAMSVSDMVAKLSAVPAMTT